jgi:hypothetical protein
MISPTSRMTMLIWLMRWWIPTAGASCRSHRQANSRSWGGTPVTGKPELEAMNCRKDTNTPSRRTPARSYCTMCMTGSSVSSAVSTGSPTSARLRCIDGPPATALLGTAIAGRRSARRVRMTTLDDHPHGGCRGRRSGLLALVATTHRGARWRPIGGSFTPPDSVQSTR